MKAVEISMDKKSYRTINYVWSKHNVFNKHVLVTYNKKP